ncbi:MULTISPECIES: hypothetical protein [Methylobacter]
MNFTYLLEGPCEPAQELLQQYKHYVVIVVLSEDMSKFVLEETGFELKSDSNALCWLIQPKHLKTAPKGSVLNRLHEFIKNKNLYGTIEHSFLAFASRDDLVSNSGGCYIPLYLHSENSEERRKEIIKCAVNKALSASKPKENPLNIDTIISAAGFITSLIGLVK